MDKTQDAIKGGLNLTGVFLESKVFTSLLRSPDILARREEPFSGITSEPFEGTIDVLAASIIAPDTAVCMSIECKRANSQQKHWVFEKRDPKSEPSFYPFDYLSASGAIGYDKNVYFSDLGYDVYTKLDRAIQVFEFKEDSGTLSHTQIEKAYFAILQANKSTSSFIQEPERIQALLGFEQKPNILYLSIVVTTANLWVQAYSPVDVDWKSGTISTDKLNLIPKDWVHFEFPLSNHLQTRTGTGLGPVKRPSFIVNADKFGEFMPKLLADCKRWKRSDQLEQEFNANRK